jgi:hypothetical protein
LPREFIDDRQDAKPATGVCIAGHSATSTNCVGAVWWA